MTEVKIEDKTFETFIPEEDIKQAVNKVAAKLNKDLVGENVIFLAILNGSFMFAADLLKGIEFPCAITFLKLASYHGDKSSGKVKQLIGLNEDIENKTVVILEDIIDTGNTMVSILKQIKAFSPAKIRIATMLFKPDALKNKISPDYVGITIPNRFILGYGLDYNGYGRNLKEIYVLNNQKSIKS